MARRKTCVFARVRREVPTVVIGCSGHVCSGRSQFGAQTVKCAGLPSAGVGLGSLLNEAASLRPAVSSPAESFGARRSAGVASLRVSDVWINEPSAPVGMKARCQKDDQFGVGQLAHMVSTPLRKGARPVRLLPGWIWLRKWLALHLKGASRYLWV